MRDGLARAGAGADEERRVDAGDDDACRARVRVDDIDGALASAAAHVVHARRRTAPQHCWQRKTRPSLALVPQRHQSRLHPFLSFSFVMNQSVNQIAFVLCVVFRGHSA